MTLIRDKRIFTDPQIPGPQGPTGIVESVTGNLVDNTDSANPIVSLPYTNTILIISQLVSTDPLIVTTLENTVVSFTSNYENIGSYSLTFSSPIFADRDKIHIAGFGDFEDSAVPMIPIFELTTLAGYYYLYIISDTKLGVAFIDFVFNPIEFVDLFGTSRLYLPDIKIYN